MTRKTLAQLIFLWFVFFPSPSLAQKIPLDSLVNKGIDLYNHGDYTKAIPVFLQSVERAKKENNNDLLCKTYSNLGNAYSQIGKSTDALLHYQLALNIAEKIKDSQRVAKITKNIGTLYSEQKDFPTALKHYDRACAMAREIKDSSTVADCLNNMGVVFEQQSEYDKAEKVYTQALGIYKKKNDEQRISMTLNNLGIVYKYLKKYALSIAHYETSLALSKKLNDHFMVAATLNNMGGVYILENNYSKALDYLMQALEASRKIEAIEIIIETYSSLADAYEGMHEYPKAIEYRKLYEKEKENYINTERSAQLAEMQTRYETEKKETEIKILKQQEQINAMRIKNRDTEIRRQQYWLIAAVAGLILILVTGYFYLSNQRLKARIRQDAAVKASEENERRRMARDIHDDLGSGLSKINFLSELMMRNRELDTNTSENAKTIAETSKKLVVNMRDLIWALNPENTTLAGLVARMHEYSSDYLEDFPAVLQLHFPNQAPDTAISKDSHREILMVLKESLNNVVKHSRATHVDINTTIDGQHFSLVVTDDGMGFDPGQKTGNGLGNMKTRITALGGTFTQNSTPGKGTRIIVQIALEKMRNNTLVV